jgi:hypothetical protein
VDTYVAEKKWLDLEHCAELLLEMVHLLWFMRAVSTELEGSLRRIATGLVTTVYLGGDPTDKLGALWRSWQPATFSKQHLLNLAELGYMTFKVLDLRLKRDDLPANDKEVEAKMEIAKLFDLHNYTKKVTAQTRAQPPPPKRRPLSLFFSSSANRTPSCDLFDFCPSSVHSWPRRTL